MPKTSPEKLAAALRANLKRRKQGQEDGASQSLPQPGKPDPGPAAKAAKKPPENRG